MSSIRFCWMLVSIIPYTRLSHKLPMTDPSFCLPNSASSPSMQLQSREASSILTTCYGIGLLVGKTTLQSLHELTGLIDTRVYNFTVYEDTGSVLVAMTGFEVKRNSTSSLPDIQRRYEVTLQPIVTCTVLPRCTTYWSRPNKETTDLIMTIADHEAQLLLRQSLDRGVTVGDDLNRQRYYQFAKEAATRRLPPLPSPYVVEDIKTKWPIHFQIIDRLSPIHHEVFETSAVSLFELRHHDIFLTCNISGNCSSPILRWYIEQVLRRRGTLRTYL